MTTRRPTEPNEVGLGEVAQAAQDEEDDEDDRHPHDGARVAVDKGVVTEFLSPVGRARHGGGNTTLRQQGQREMAAVGPHITQQAQIDVERTLRRRRLAAPHDGAQGLPAGPSLTVAMLISAKPRRPSTSMAVITDWCVARPSARSVTRTAAVRPGLFQHRRAQGLRTGVDELFSLTRKGAFLGHGDHQWLALRGLRRNRIRLRKVHAHPALVRETAREHEEDHEEQHHVE